MRETLAKSLSNQTFACTHQWLLTTIRRNPISSHGCEVSTVSTNPTLVLTTLFLCFRHTSFSFTQTCHHLICSFEEEFCCVDQAGPDLVILLTPLLKYYLFKVFIYCWESRKWVCVLGVAVTAHMWNPEENYAESVLSACMRASGMELTARLLWQGFYVLSHLISLVFSF